MARLPSSSSSIENSPVIVAALAFVGELVALAAAVVEALHLRVAAALVLVQTAGVVATDGPTARLH